MTCKYGDLNIALKLLELGFDKEAKNKVRYNNDDDNDLLMTMMMMMMMMMALS